jgi:hypothetical protein
MLGDEGHKALSASGMEPEGYHSADAPRYHSLDCIWATGPESCLFLSHNHPIFRGGGGPSFSGHPLPRGASSARKTL